MDPVMFTALMTNINTFANKDKLTEDEWACYQQLLRYAEEVTRYNRLLVAKEVEKLEEKDEENVDDAFHSRSGNSR
jgi:hypothetical protein